MKEKGKEKEKEIKGSKKKIKKSERTKDILKPNISLIMVKKV